MYSYEERIRAVKEYIKQGYRANRTVAKLGYPTRQALRTWYREYEKNGDLHRKFNKESPYTEEQKKAIAYYYENGRNLTKTSRELGYVNRNMLREWVAETIPAEEIDCVVQLFVRTLIVGFYQIKKFFFM